MSEISQFIAISIAESRLKKAREKLRPKLLQQAELAPERRIVEDDEGVVSDVVRCPACNDTGFISVPAPFGLEVRARTSYEVDIKGMPDDVLLWAIRHGIYNLSLNSKTFDAYGQDPSPESLYNLGIIGAKAHLVSDPVATLNVIPAEKLKEELR